MLTRLATQIAAYKVQLIIIGIALTSLFFYHRWAIVRAKESAFAEERIRVFKELAVDNLDQLKLRLREAQHLREDNEQLRIDLDEQRVELENVRNNINANMTRGFRRISDEVRGHLINDASIPDPALDGAIRSVINELDRGTSSLFNGETEDPNIFERTPVPAGESQPPPTIR